jgi:small subunit ribosomal protein S20
MPILSNAKKALRSSAKKASFNRNTKSRLKTALDRVKAQPSVETASGAFSMIDRAIKKHLLHKNKASRLKSQLSKLISGDSTDKSTKSAAPKAAKKTTTKAKTTKAKSSKTKAAK